MLGGEYRHTCRSTGELSELSGDKARYTGKRRRYPDMAQVLGERRMNHVVADIPGGYDRRSGVVDRRQGNGDRRRSYPDRRQSHLSLAEPSGGAHHEPAVEISVVMPCLNEVESVGICVKKAWEGIRLSGRPGEVIVADNGSTDGSIEVAEAAGARVVHQPARGYGNAYLAGFAAAHGSIIVMGDSDDSYDFTVLPDLIAPIIDDGHDYVLGSRLTGKMEQGAMPWTHRWIGNPMLTAFLNMLFKLRVSDAHSGYRVFTARRSSAWTCSVRAWSLRPKSWSRRLEPSSA